MFFFIFLGRVNSEGVGDLSLSSNDGVHVELEDASLLLLKDSDSDGLSTST